jgi:peptidyl-prolyl cis-trans isomerase D
MLQNIGDKLKGQAEGGGRSGRWFWYLIIGVLALVFAAWGPYTVVDLTFGQDGYAAKVNGEEIPATRINDLWQRQLPQLSAAYGGELDEEQRRALQQELLDLAVRELAVAQHARKVGFAVSDAQAGRAFREEEAFQIDGVFNVAEARVRLANEGITEQDYLQDLRGRLITNQLLGVMGVTDFLTPAESRRLLALLDEERELRFLLLDPERFAGNEPVAPEAIEAYYQANAEDFAIPESVQLAYAELSLGDISATVQVSEAELAARYEQEKSKYVQPETRQARHILIAVDDPAQDAARAAVAQDLYKQIQGGADFAALATANSQDTASARNGGDLGWAGRDTYVQAFGDKLFSMKEGEVSEPVKTEFGYHIIRLEGIRPETGLTFENVRNELAVQMRDEQAIGRFNAQQDRLQEELEEGTTLDTLVTEYKMRRGTVDQFERGAGGLPLGSDATLNREVFSEPVLVQRRIGGPVQLSEDRVTIFQVTDHRPASTRPLEEVRGEIVAALIRERGAAAAMTAANAAVEQLAAGRSFEQVAATLKASPEPARFVARNTPDLPVELRDAVFAAARPAADRPVRQALKLEDGSVALFEATASRTQSDLDIPQLVELRSQRERERYTRRDIEAYIATVVEAAKVRQNPQAFALQ